MSGDSINLSLSENLKLVFRVLLAQELHTCMPGKIEEYDSVARKATVNPGIRKKYLDGTELEIPPIPGVPVTFLGVGSAGLRLPESQYVGQNVVLIFSERSIDEWVLKGNLSNPGDTRKFDMSDALAICFINAFNEEDSGGNNCELHYENSVVRIRPDGIIEIGVNTFKKLINEEFKNEYDNHVHNFTAAPTGTFSTSTPAKIVGTIPGTPVGSVPATFLSQITDSMQTSKLMGE